MVCEPFGSQTCLDAMVREPLGSQTSQIRGHGIVPNSKGSRNQGVVLHLHLVSITLVSRAPGVVLELPSCSLVLPRSSHVTSSLMSPMSSPTSSRR